MSDSHCISLGLKGGVRNQDANTRTEFSPCLKAIAKYLQDAPEVECDKYSD